MNERNENKGRLHDLRLESKRLKLSIQGLIHTLRSAINPHDDFLEMDEELIHEQAFELSQKIDLFKGTAKKIKLLKKDLGID
ncbi:MAG: hypothetical protein KOO65_05285 [Desulfobacterales bacterium]|nr:hypothetical protein [Desulfobacterales bacterium]